MSQRGDAFLVFKYKVREQDLRKEGHKAIIPAREKS